MPDRRTTRTQSRRQISHPRHHLTGGGCRRRRERQDASGRAIAPTSLQSLTVASKLATDGVGVVSLAESPKGCHSSIYPDRMSEFSSKRLVVIKRSGGLQERFKSLATKVVGMMTADEKAMVVVATTGSLEDGIVTLWSRRQELDVRSRDMGSLISYLIEEAHENHIQLHEELLRLSRSDRQKKPKRERANSG